ncbi:MAG: TRAP transporter large permease [Clostridiales Family XIII bacterium]|jgi:C4-dicarboxylate transporter DctM subunit|nr:TRAP transporter large permease [Clostridiales Family XIII bacterium]
MGTIVLFVALFAMILIGVPVGFAIGGATIIAMYYFTTMNMVTVAQYCYYGIDSFTVMAIPFFLLAGVIMSTGGIARRIVDFAYQLIGFVTGGLGAVSVVACMFFGALSGSGMATTSAIGSMMIPEMKKKGYIAEYCTTLVCFSGIIGLIIPPSLAYVLYGSTTKTSISALFLAGVIPGVLIGIILIVFNWVMCKKLNMGQKESFETKTTVKAFLIERATGLAVSFKRGFWALLSPVIILGGIYSGVFTPTEAACVSVVYSLIISAFVYRELDMKGIYKTFVQAAVLNGITSFLLGYATVFSTYLAYENIPKAIYQFLQACTDNKFVMLLLINIVLLIIGCFLDTVPAIIVMAPILLPAVIGYGVDPIHFGIIMTINLGIGLCTPPYGCNLFVGAAVGRVKMERMFRYVIPFFLVSIASLLLVTYVPQLSLALL